MSIKERKLNQIDRTILNLKHREAGESRGLKKVAFQTSGFLHHLYYEIVKNDVTIRAESLSYFTFLSMMPLMAGAFLLIGLFSKWAPVQQQFEDLLSQALAAIPEEQRDTLLGFILQFKDTYLAQISQKSAAIGIFALGILIWISGKVFFNIESLMNRIWAVRNDRPFLERIQNFILCMVIFPVSLVIALSLPGIIEHFGQKELGLFLHEGIPVLILFFSLSFIFKYFPNTAVAWRSAHWGALVGTVCFGLSHIFLRVYFHFGTATGYGKAAVLPIFAFFIYVSWLTFIIGIEVSLICQSSHLLNEGRLPHGTLGQALLLEKIISVFETRFQSNLGPINANDLSGTLQVSPLEIEAVLRFLRKKEVIIRIVKKNKKEVATFLLSHSVKEDDLLKLIKDYLDLDLLSQRFDVFRLLNRLKPS